MLNIIVAGSAPKEVLEQIESCIRIESMLDGELRDYFSDIVVAAHNDGSLFITFKGKINLEEVKR